MTPARLIASGLGAGFFPVAPGTFASFVALAPGLALLWLGPTALVVAIIAATVIGVWAIRQVDVGDAGWIVVDEFAGQWIAMLPLTLAASSRTLLIGTVVSFALFRLFDVTKPGPVGWADRRHDAFGVMADDLIAGALAAVILYTGMRLLFH